MSFLLAEVGQVLRNLGDEGEGAGGPVVGVLLGQLKQGRGHHRRTQEAEEQRGADQTLADVWSPPVTALLSPRRKHLFQLPGEHSGNTHTHTHTHTHYA